MRARSVFIHDLGKILVSFVLSSGFLSAFAKADASEVLKPYFGSYRVKSYQGLENVYSGKYFVPTINIEPSLKLRNADGRSAHTLNFNLEVPLEKENSIYLKFVFLETPVDGAEIEEKPDGATILFEGDLLQKNSDTWITCKMRYITRLRPIDSSLVSIEYKKVASAPCSSETHSLILSRIKEL